MKQWTRIKEHVMATVWGSWQSLKNEKGQGLIEYALILVLIAAVVVAILTGLGTKVNSVYSNVNSKVP